ncbi:MAG: glycosyltransferase family 1 protein [Anaerolineae bacterium]|nr:glycosyltransferase family 1 protein [Anaerolineae bacterium]
MRVGVDGRYIQDHFPGIGRYTYSLINALASLATDDTLVVLYNPALPNSRYDLTALTRYPNVELVRLDVPTFSLAEQLRLPSVISRLSCDVFHSPYYVKPYRLPVLSILTLYDVIPTRYPAYYPRRTRLLIRWLHRLALRTAAHCIAISETTRADFVRYYGLAPQRITAIPLAADEHFRPAEPAAIAAVRGRYSLPPHYVLYLGSNKPHKNLPRLIDAFSRITHHASQITHHASRFTLVIAGAWDPRYPEPRQRAEVSGLESVVRFLGPVPEGDLPALYSGAIAFVFPSLYEGFGLPVLEAMSCGVPVACSNTSSLPEIVGQAALTFDPADVEDMAAALSRLLSDAGLRAELRQRGLEWAQRFSWAETARRTLEVYHGLCVLAGRKV